MKKIEKYIKITGIMLLSIIMLIGCHDFEDLNTNPDDTTKVSASLLVSCQLDNV